MVPNIHCIARFKPSRLLCAYISISTTKSFLQLHNEELNDLHSSRVIKSKRMRWVGHVALMGERTGVYRFLVGKPEGKGQVGRPRPRLENNMKMNLQQVGCGGIDWIEMAQERDRWRVL
jgi:hypothetical protein